MATSVSISQETLNKIAELIYRELGIVVDRNNQRILASKIKLFLMRNKLTEEDLISKVERDRRLFEDLISSITVNETYFFREREHFDALVELIKRKNLSSTKILSIPCSTGEEPFSIAMTLDDAFGSSLRFDIVGVDVDRKAIEMAQAGIYMERSVSKVPAKFLTRYFDKEGEFYKIKRTIALKVRFLVGNIFDVAFLKRLGMFDFIFCRNLLIYFDSKKREEALNNLAKIHKSGGYLFIGKSETIIGLRVPYVRETVGKTVVYRLV